MLVGKHLQVVPVVSCAGSRAFSIQYHSIVTPNDLLLCVKASFSHPAYTDAVMSCILPSSSIQHFHLGGSTQKLFKYLCWFVLLDGLCKR